MTPMGGRGHPIRRVGMGQAAKLGRGAGHPLPLSRRVRELIRGLTREELLRLC
jgi:hypothetical protein